MNTRKYITKLLNPREISHPQLKGSFLTAEKTKEIKEPLSELFTPQNLQSTQVVGIPKEKKSIREIFADNGWVVVSCSGKACRTPEGGMPGGDCGVTCEWRKRVRSQLASFTTTDRMYHRYSCLSIPFLAAHSCRIVTAKERELVFLAAGETKYKGRVSSLVMQSRFKLQATLFHNRIFI